MNDSPPKTHAERMREYRARKKAEGVPAFTRSEESKQAEKERLQNKNIRESTLWSSAIVFIDGELADDKHYNLFQAISLWNDEYTVFTLEDENIDMLDIANFLFRVRYALKKKGAAKVMFIGYSLGFDADQAIKNLLPDQTASLEEVYKLVCQTKKSYGAKRGPGWIETQRIANYDMFIGAKSWRFEKIKKIAGEDKIIGRIRTADIWSLEGGSFLSRVVPAVRAACERGEYEDTRALQLACAIAIVNEGKALRGDFIQHGWNMNMVKTYNIAEGYLACAYVKQILNMCRDLNIIPRSLAGPAPLARAMMRKYKANEHIKPAEYDTLEFQTSELMQWGRAAQHAGRIENLGQGVVTGYDEYDIRSCYPSSQRLLPCMAHGYWQKLSEQEALQRIAEKYSSFDTNVDMDMTIYDVAWQAPESDEIGPFPVRRDNKSIVYPLMGGGKVYAPELYSALQANPQLKFIIDGAYVWHPMCENDRPFAYMNEAFKLRQEYKQAGNTAELIIKLALNSSYGVTVQMAGAYVVIDEECKVTEVHTPPLTNIFSGGYITACGRAKVYKAAMQAGKGNVYAFATDSVKLKKGTPVSLDMSDELGAWEYKRVEQDVLLIAAGYLISKDGKVYKSRGTPGAGFGTNKLSYETLLAAYETMEDTFTINTRPYLSAKQCLSVRGPDSAVMVVNPLWGTFAQSTRSVNLTLKAISSKRDVSQLERDYNTSSWLYAPPFRQAIGNKPENKIIQRMEESDLPPEYDAQGVMWEGRD